MPSRSAALVALLVLTGCTGVDGNPTPPPRSFSDVVTIDLDAVSPAGVDVLDLTAGPDGALALLADTADPAVTYLAPVDAAGVGEVRRVDGGRHLLVMPDGTALVVGPGTLTRVPPGGGPDVVPLDADATAAALSPDGRRLYLADERRVAAVDPSTGETAGTVDLDDGLTVQRLAASDDGVTALLSDARAPDLADVAALATWDDRLRETARVELAPDQPASVPFGLRLAGDGTAVATLSAGGDEPFRVVVVEDGEVTASHAIPGTDRTPPDLAVSPEGRVAYLPVAGFEVTSGVITLDLDSGEQLDDVRLCDGQGTFGRVALGKEALVVVGSCISSDAPSSTAFALR
ncbi:YncE family protein [Geodermatophilus nigrescens]|uniref:DNA-binding beta-propeller fold protein YncE n=1 Tax=Geodermatophilus nigrescens TaxID=1070870 RepID=A0A1M5JQX0_9ACTN|nr:hypothetical protein [Geodermatophilus nigrescens]SHG42982.1 hypothetical protein SAMN05444351_2616 [Geodermatophilus nigrescens]